MVVFNRDKMIESKSWIISFLVSFIFITLFSFTTSFLNPYIYQYDSAYFQSVGSIISKGMLPYRDFFDHKAPLLYAIEAVCYMTPYPRLALQVVQALFMSIWVKMIYETMIEKYSFKWTMFFSFSILAFYSFMINGGNLTEEYSLNLIFIALFQEIRWFMKDDRGEHPLKYAFLDGVIVALVMLFLMKNAIMLCCIIASYCFYLIFTKHWVNFIKNVLCLMGGFCTIIIPTCIIFAALGIFEDFCYATLIFNVMYLNATSGGLRFSAKILIFLIPEILMVWVGIRKLFKKDYFLTFTLVFTSFCMSYMFVGGNQYKHYFMLGVPALFFAVMLADEIKVISVETFLLVACIVVALAYLPNQLSTYTKENVAESKGYIDSMRSVVNAVPEEERDDIAEYNFGIGQMCYYVVNDLRPLQNHPYLTEFHGNIDHKIVDDYLNFLKERRPKWIIMPTSSHNEEILGYIEDNYVLVKQAECKVDMPMMTDDDTMMLYRLVE